MNNQLHIITNTASVNRPPLVMIGKDHISYDLNVLDTSNPPTKISEQISYQLKNVKDIKSLTNRLHPVIREPKNVLDRYNQNKELSKGQIVELDRWKKREFVEDLKIISYLQRSPVYRYMNICSEVIHKSHDSFVCEPYHCHTNSVDISLNHQSEYGIVQGFVLRIGKEGRSTLYTHSWNIDQDGNYVDFTPIPPGYDMVIEDYPEIELYVGLQIPTEFFVNSFVKLLKDGLDKIFLIPYINVFPQLSLQ